MNIFIQGRKDGYNTLYPIPTPAEFFQFASDIQRIDAQKNAQYYGKSFYAIAFNGSGCIFTKYIIGYDTLRSNIGNIGISVFIPNNKKMSGTVITSLLDELIKIYTTNYCPDFKFNNQKQEDWALFESAANKYKVEDNPSAENYLYGSKDAAYHFYNDTTEIEKYLGAPYQENFKERKQVYFIERQSQHLLELIKHDQTDTANLTGNIDWDNTPHKLRDYRQRGTNGVSIEIRANNILLRDNDTIYTNDDLYIKYSKNYHKAFIIEKGKLLESPIKEYLKTFDNSIDVKKDIELDPVIKPVEIRINDSKGNPITDAVIVCKCKSTNSIPNKEVSQNQNTIDFLGEEQKYEWTISAKKDRLSGEETFTPEFKSVVKLTLREVKYITLNIMYKDKRLESRNLTFYDDDIRNEHTETINIRDFNSKKVPFFPKDKFDAFFVELEKQVIQQPTTQGPKGGPHENGRSNEEPKMPIKIIIIIASIAFFLIFGTYLLVNEFRVKNSPDKGTKEQTSEEIKRPLEGDSLSTEKLKKDDTNAATVTVDPHSKIVKSNEKKEEEDNKKKEEDKKKEEEDKKKKEEDKKEKEEDKKEKEEDKKEKEIALYLTGSELKGNKLIDFQKIPDISDKLKKSITLALKFWTLDGKKNETYNVYKSEVKNDEYLKNNSTLNTFLKNVTSDTKYPKGISGAGKTKTLDKFSGEAK
jgi:hypothetical protein